MFLGNLSSEAERRARKNKKKTEMASAVFATLAINAIYEAFVEEPDDSSMRREKAGREVVYTSENSEVPRDVIADYFDQCSRIILLKPNIDEIIQDSERTGLPLHGAAMEFQRDILTNNFGIEKNFGCKILSSAPNKYPDDERMQDLSQNFVYCAMKSYVLAVRQRALSQYANTKLRSEGGLKRETILEFFEACNALNCLKETKEYLKGIANSGKASSAALVELQRNMLVLLGYEPDYAITCLEQIGQIYQRDSEVMTKMQHFMVCAQIASNEANMTDEQRDAFYAPIPRMMRHFPQLYVIEQQSQAMSRQHTQTSSGPMGILGTPEGREILQKVLTKIQEAKQLVEERNVASWTVEQREEYFEKFGEHSLLDKMFESGTDALSRIKAMGELTEEEFADALTMQAVMSEDLKAGGTIARRINEAQAKMWQAAAEAGKDGDYDAAAKTAHQESGKSASGRIGSVIATLGSVNNFNRVIQSSQNQSCPHHNRPATNAPDVAAGASKMDR